MLFRSKVEIIKALYNDAELLILDEPTAVLTAHLKADIISQDLKMAVHAALVYSEISLMRISRLRLMM